MCGICGQVYCDPGRSVEKGSLEEMNAVMRHRGPDSEGYYIDGNVGLAMRRLSIIDLNSGNQPIKNETGTIWIVFNGEIYNYREISSHLKSRGHTLHTKSDTEVIVHLYEDYGLDCVHHLRGMFAFAIWDGERRRLFIARDRLGQKPLYYADYKGVFLFGSELKCILEYPGFPRVLDLEAVHHYLTLQYVPEPWSAIKGIRKLPSAHRLIWEDGEIQIDRYWDIIYEPKWTYSRNDLQEHLRQAIMESVRMRLISDVPLGAHLSGGIDSSIIVGLMSDMMSSPVKTFSIGFQAEGFDELPYARQISRKFETDHQEYVIKPDVWRVLPKLIEHFDEPFADAAALPTWYLAQLTRKCVTVVLNGDGADEAFAGYQRYYADVIADVYRGIPGILRHHFLDHLIHTLPTRPDYPLDRNYAMAFQRLTQAADLPHTASIVRWGSYFSEAEKCILYNHEVQRILETTASYVLLQEIFQRATASTRLDKTLYTDLTTYLPGALLPKVDRMTMAHSLEARSPFLDHHVVELAARIPSRWKIRGMRTKWILRETFADLLSNGIKRRKQGFSVPFGLWFRGPLYEQVRSRLLNPNACLSNILRSKAINDIIEENRKGQADNGKRIWALLILETWLCKYHIEI